MKTVTSVSGGQSSAYIAANYPSDYLVFALVTTEDQKCKHPDPHLRKMASDKIGREFVGTLEEDDSSSRRCLNLNNTLNKTFIGWLGKPLKNYRVNKAVSTQHDGAILHHRNED